MTRAWDLTLSGASGPSGRGTTDALSREAWKQRRSGLLPLRFIKSGVSLALVLSSGEATCGELGVAGGHTLQVTAADAAGKYQRVAMADESAWRLPCYIGAAARWNGPVGRGVWKRGIARQAMFALPDQL